MNFSVPRGEAFGLIGANGAGKSTLLKILSRITEPTSGMVDLHGRVAPCWKLVPASIQNLRAAKTFSSMVPF